MIATRKISNLRGLIAISIAFVLSCAHADEAPMTQEKLEDLILDIGTDVVISGNSIQFEIDGTRLICVSDASADRMRIIAPIAPLSETEGEQIMLAMAANFHSVLDARYAIGSGIVYAAYLHPLSSLTAEELKAAVAQVAVAQQTFGTDYSSGVLVFPGF